jgi:WD40 repeat protein
MAQTLVYNGSIDNLKLQARCVALSWDGRFVVCGGLFSKVLVKDMVEGAVVMEVLHTTKVYAVAISFDGLTIAYGGDDGYAVVFDVNTHSEIFKSPKHAKRINAVGLTSDASLLVVGGDDMQTVVYDVRNKVSIAAHPHKSGVRSLAICAPNPAAAGRYTVIAADWSNLITALTLDVGVGGGNSSGGGAVKFSMNTTMKMSNKPFGCGVSADGRTVVAGGDDSQISVFDLSNAAAQIIEHKLPEYVASTAISADGSVIAAGGGGKSVLVMDAACVRSMCDG